MNPLCPDKWIRMNKPRPHSSMFAPPNVGLYRQISYVLQMLLATLLGMPRDVSLQYTCRGLRI